MSSVINLNQAALYGFITEWGEDAFAGTINVGNWGSGEIGRFQQNYNYQTTTTNTWGDKNVHGHSGTTYPYSKLSASSATLTAGSAQGNLSVSNSQWSAASSTNYSAYLNLYNLLSPQSGQNASSTLSVENPTDYNVIPAPGGSYTGNDRSYTSYGMPTFNVTNNVNDSAVIYQTVSSSPLTIGEGQVTTSVQDLADGDDLNVTFQFLPGATDAFSISATFTQTISSSNTQGTSQSGSTSGSNSATLGISATETGSVGIDPSDQVSASLQESYQDSWETAWSQTSTADFSSTDAISNTNSFTFTATENLNNAVQTGTQTTANGNQTPLYQYTTTPPGQTTPVTFDLVAGGYYEWMLQFYAGSIQNIVTGEYTLSGNTGSIADSSGNTVGGNIAQAFYYANQGYAWDALGYGYNPIVSFNASNPDDITSVTINGSTISSTNESVNLYLTLAAVSTGSTASEASTATSSARLSSNPLNGVAAPASNKKTWTNLEDGLLVLPAKTRNPTVYHGNNSANYVRDTSGQDLIQTESGNDYVMVQGNSVQANNPGDIVKLGRGRDTADMRKAVGTNSVLTESGADRVLDGPTNLMADLGSGSDRYVYGGGHDIVRLGQGADVVDLQRGSGSIVIGDFSVGKDVVTGLDKKARLVWNDSLAAFTIQKSDRITGNFFVASGTPQALSSEFWYGMALQNIRALRLNRVSWTGNSWQDVRTRYGICGYNNPDLHMETWSKFAQTPENIHTAARFIARSAGAPALSSDQLRDIDQLAGHANSFSGFTAATIGYIF